MSQTFRPATLAERKTFYEREFSLARVKAWFKGRPLPQIAALDAGTDTGIIKDKRNKGFLLYIRFDELLKKIHEYLPEDVYYDRDYYADPNEELRTLTFVDPLLQELVFDVDADNIPCTHARHERLCSLCLLKAEKAARALQSHLRGTFSKVSLVYSGKGFHVHVLDKKAYLMTHEQRVTLTKRLAHYPIDPWVSGGGIHLIRLPHSLHGEVSHIALPVTTAFDEADAKPRFLS